MTEECGISVASKKGDSIGCGSAGGVAKSMFWRRESRRRKCSLPGSGDEDNVSVAARGDGMSGMCRGGDVGVDVPEDASLACRTGKRPLLLLPPRVTCVALPRTDDVGEGPWPGTITGTSLILSVACSSGVPGELSESGVDGVDDAVLTETIRGARRAAVVAGMGAAAASSQYTSDAMDSRASEGVIDCMVYLVSRLLLRFASRIDDAPEYVLPLRSSMPKNNASPPWLNGLAG